MEAVFKHKLPLYDGLNKNTMITDEHIELFLAQAHRYGDAKLMLCSSGNLSWRIGEEALISGTGSWVPTLAKEKVSICNIASGTPTNGVKPSMESTFHLGVLRERPDVNVVLHFQSEYATAISCMKNKPTNFNVTAEIPCHVGSEIPVIPYYRPGSPELAKAVVEAMLKHNSVLLTNHGQVVCGKDFDQVYERATFFEMACRIIVQSGGDYSVLTPEEIEQTVKYCRHDVEQTIKVFLEKVSEFNAVHGIIQAFPKETSLYDIGDSEARITAKVLGCSKTHFGDEFDFFFLPCLKLKKYKYVQEWFAEKRKEALEMGLQDFDKKDKKTWYKSQNFETIVAGIPHTFGFGGLHGASDKPIHRKGQILHVDVNNYYPSMLIAWGLVTRAATNNNFKLVYDTRKAMKKKQVAAAKAGRKAEAKQWKKAQLPYKKMLNALSGAMKDETNAAYDPRNNNCMCINGQLMLLDLIEHLEVVPGLELIQSNTDGLIIWIPDTDEAFEMVDDICWEWEQRCSTEQCSILLELDNISEIYQKDVNNYLWIGTDGGIERIGAYVKELSAIDYDLPILNKALVDYMVKKIPVEQTINQCDDLIMFQKIVKLSNNYNWVEHEHGTGQIIKTTKHRDGTRTEVWSYPTTQKYTYKSYRVFASNRVTDGRLLRRKVVKLKGEKFGNTPDHSFIYNDSVIGVKVPPELDKQWYIDLARKRLKQFGIAA